MLEIDPGAPLEGPGLARRILRLAGRVALVGGLLCCSLALPQKILQLWERDRAMARENEALQQELEATRRELQRLQEEKRFLQTRAGIVMEARRLGYGFPGEIRLMPVPPKDPETVSEGRAGSSGRP
jgi:hypothetical protein